MARSSAGRLYSPQLLSLATELADYPYSQTLPLTGEARSRSCGSSVKLGARKDNDARVSELGISVAACAVGQAAAAIFASAATGRDLAELQAALQQIASWLEQSDAPVPQWPRFGMLEPARAFPARHDAIALPWKAAIAALSKADRSG